MATSITWPHKYFRRDELECKCGCGGVPKAEFISKLDTLRASYGKPMKISSAYRCRSHNATVGGSVNSRHIEGIAVDILINSAEAYLLVNIALSQDFNGIGVAKTFLHLDTRKKEEGRIWAY